MNAITKQIQRRPYYVAARNSIEAGFLAAAKFARDEIVGCKADLTRSSLNHHTTDKPVWRCSLDRDGQIIVVKA